MEKVSQSMYEIKQKVDTIISELPIKKKFVTYDPDDSWYYVLDLPRKIQLIFNIYQDEGLDNVYFSIYQDREMIIGSDTLSLEEIISYMLQVLDETEEPD